MLKISEKELLHISNVKLRERYDYFIKRICDQQEVCVLREINGLLLGNEVSNGSYVHLWSAKEFGEKYKELIKSTESVDVIDFHYLGSEFISFVKLKNASISIMPIKETVGYEVSTEQLISDIQKYNDEWFS